MKMAVFVHVRAIARRTAIQSDLSRQTRFHERIEAIIDRRVGNVRHRFFGAHENFFRRRMIALVQKHIVNLLALRRETQAGRAQLFGQVLFVCVVAARLHRGKIYRRETASQDLEQF